MKEVSEEGAFLQLSALCAGAEHCQYEMVEKMKKWGLTDEAQARVMERLINGRYVDDERYTRAFVSDKIRYNKWGRRKVEQALWQKRKTTRADSDYQLNQKLVRFALGRGFTYDIIRQCIGDCEALEEAEEDVF